MHEPYKSDDSSCKNAFGVEKVLRPSKVERSECMNRLVTTRSYITILPRLTLAY